MKLGFISINDNVFEALITESFDEQSQGLMYCHPPTPVMVFKYSKPLVNKFWMKNTYAELDIVFAKNNIISQIRHGKPLDLSIIGDDTESDLVVEFPFGTIEKIKAKVGYNIKLI